MTNSNQRRVRFGPFELDLVTGELWRNRTRLKLEGQPFQILKLLLARPGELITREELRHTLWDSDTFVDFEHGVNTAIRKLRQALKEDAEKPRYIQTIPRRGYRLICEVSAPAEAEPIAPAEAEPIAPASAEVETATVTDDTLEADVAGSQVRRSRPRILAWIGIGAICIAAVVFIYRLTRPRPELPRVSVVPFTTYPGYEFCPAFSPDGSRIAFEWNRDSAVGFKDFDLYVKVKGSENLLQLTHQPSLGLCPTWSPDGTQIAFIRFSDSPSPGAGLRLISALGGAEKGLLSMTNGEEVSMPPVWSPDGKWIVIGAALHKDDPHSIYFVSADTGELKLIPHPEGCPNEHWAAFSHSGDQWAFICQFKPDQEYGIFRARLADGFPSGTATLVTRFSTAGRPGGLLWAANDKRLLLSRPLAGTGYEIDEVSLADGSIQKLPFGQDAEQIAISPRGDKLAFVVHPFQHIGIFRKDLLKPETTPVNLVPSTRREDDAIFSPDGKYIAFTSNRDGIPEVWISDVDGTNMSRLSNLNSSDDGWPRWSPDSRKIVFSSHHSGRWELYVVDIVERLPHRLECNLSGMLVASWSHDGKWIYLQGESDDKAYRCPVGGGQAVAMSTARGMNPWESYDGKLLYFADQLNSCAIKKVPLLSPGTESPVEGMPTVADTGAWSLSRDGIYFMPPDAPKSLRFFDFATRKVRHVFDFANITGDLAVSQDGHWLTYTQLDQDNADIMLVENLH